MDRKINNKGVSLIELIIVIAIMAILVGVISPSMVKYVEKARKVKVEKEASEVIKAAQVAFVEVGVAGKAPGPDSIKNKTVSSSPYYKDGTLYGNLTNWTVHNGVVPGASNGPFADAFFKLLGISYGKEWKSGSSSISISESQPKLNPAGSMTKDCIFQVFYDQAGNMVVEYSREGYFVRMEGSYVAESVKIKNATDKHFTSWK